MMLVILLAFFFGFPLSGHAQEILANNAGALSVLRQCYEKPEEVIECGTREIRTLLDNKTGKELAGFLQDNLPEYMCHQFSHIIGREIYKKTHSLELGMEECSYGCSGACFHGVVEAAFLEQLKIDPGSADIHITEDLVLKNAKEFCKTATMCHGVGHMLFQLYNSFEKPLTICKDVSSGVSREACYWGVFMDHAMQFSAYNLLLGNNKKQTYDSSNILSPCDQVDEEFRPACYWYQPRLQDKIFDETGIQERGKRRELQKSACETLDTDDRQFCFEGLGVAFFNAGISNPELARAWSENLALTADKKAFTRGMIRYMVAQGYTSKAFAYCTALPKRFERWGCYYNTLSTLVYVHAVLQ